MRSKLSRAAGYLSSVKVGAAVGIAACSIACLVPIVLTFFGVSTFVLVCNLHEAVALTLVVGAVATVIAIVVRKHNARKDTCCTDAGDCSAPVQISVRRPEERPAARPLVSADAPGGRSS